MEFAIRCLPTIRNLVERIWKNIWENKALTGDVGA